MAVSAAQLKIEVTADTAQAEAGLGRVDSKVKDTAGNTAIAGTALMGAGLAVAAGFGLAIGTAANFEAQISAINSVANLTGDQLGQVKDKALELGASTSFSASEAAAGMEELLKAGISYDDVMGGAAQAALDMAAATGTSVPQAAQMMSTAVNTFGTDAAEAATIWSQAANASAADAEGLALGISAVGPVAASMGLDLRDTTSALALFSQHGLQGSDAGTSFKTMLLSMAAPTEAQSQLMNDLGISFFDAQGNFVGLEGAADQLGVALDGMTQQQKMATLEALFGTDAIRAANILYEEGAEGIQGMTAEMAKQGTVQEMARKRMDNMKGAVERLKGSIETAMIIVGSGFTPILTKLADFVSALVQAFLGLPEPIQKVITFAVALAGGLAFLAGALGVVAPMAGVLGAGLALLLSPIVLIIAAIAALGAALYLAYTKDFMGFGQAVDNLIEKLGVFKPAIEDIKDAFQALKEGNFGEVWDELKEAFASLGVAFDTLGPQIVSALAGVWDSITGFDWGGAIAGIWESINGAFSAIPWGEIASTIGSLATTLVSKGAELIQGLIDGAIERWPTFSAWLVATGSTIASLIGSAASWLLQTGRDAIQGLIDGAIERWPTFSAWLSSTATMVGGALLGAATWLLQTGRDIIQGIINGAIERWPTFSSWLASAAVMVAGALLDAQSWLLQKGRDVIQGLINGAIERWLTFAAWLGSMATMIGGLIVDAATWLLQQGRDVIGGLYAGIIAKWPEVTAWLVGIGGRITAAVGELLRTLRQKGLDAIAGLYDGVLDKWAELKGWLSGMPSYLFTAVPDLTRILRFHGVNAISGLYDGVLDRWAALKSWLSGLGGYIAGAVPSLGMTLFSAGWDAISGLVSGLWAAADSILSSALSGIAGFVRDGIAGALKINSPSRVMMPIGASVPEGLAVGIRKEASRSLAASLDRLGEQVSGFELGSVGVIGASNGVSVSDRAINGSGASEGGRVVNQTFNIEIRVDDLADLVEARDFLAGLPRERSLIFGGAA